MLTRMTLSWVVVSIVCARAMAGQTPAAAATRPATRIQLDFPGGTLETYAEAVRSKLSDANIVIDGDTVRNIRVPKAPLRRMSLPQTLQWVTTTVDARRHGVILQPTRSAGDSAEVFVFTVAQAPVVRVPVEPEIFVKDYTVDSFPNHPDWAQTVRAAVAGKLTRRDSTHSSGSVQLVPGKPSIVRVRGTRIDIQDADQTVDVLQRSRYNEVVVPLERDVKVLQQRLDSLRNVVIEVQKRLPK